jgi:hypothetical protein
MKRSSESLPQGKIKQMVATFRTSYIIIASIEKSIDYSLSFSKTNISVQTNLIMEGERVKSAFKKAFDKAKRLLVIESSCHANVAASRTLRGMFNAIKHEFVENIADCKAKIRDLAEKISRSLNTIGCRDAGIQGCRDAVGCCRI